MDFYAKNRQDWITILNKIFPNGVPKYCEWNKIEDIIAVLNVIGSIPSSNHIFYPSGGGMDIESSQKSIENGCIEIFTGLTDILKPKALLFYSFDDPIWNYFRIETYELEPSGVYELGDYPSEEVTDLGEGQYISRIYWDEGEYQEEKLPNTARVLTRYFKGSFVIFAKSSHYNRHSSTYDARHNKMSSDEFKAYIEKTIKNGW